MEALASYSKYLGCYDKWQEIRKRYSLRWSNGNESLQALQRFFDEKMSLDYMIDKVKEMMRVLPKPMALIIRHALLTGLRPSEAVESARLINDKEAFPKYYDAKQMTLCHYKFSEIFLRATKKAYISYITLDNLQPIANLGLSSPHLERHPSRM